MKNKLYYCFWLEQKLNVKIMSAVEIYFNKFNQAQRMWLRILHLFCYNLHSSQPLREQLFYRGFDVINQSINQSIIYLVMQVYRVAAIRLMWTYNELMKCKTKITYKITLWHLNIQYESLQ